MVINCGRELLNVNVVISRRGVYFWTSVAVFFYLKVAATNGGADWRFDRGGL